jgi:hypothetical protein
VKAVKEALGEFLFEEKNLSQRADRMVVMVEMGDL